jgi:hypothetical protein
VRFALLLALVACKSESSTPSTGSGVPVVVEETKPALKAMLPKLASAKILSAKSPNDAYALETWCIDDADAVAQITAALERDGWTAVRTKADTAVSDQTKRIAIAAMKGDIRFSARTGGGDTRCAGTYITANVMRLGALDRVRDPRPDDRR